ncbi:MAG: response regulator [Ardenticatenales bacterium]|nr:response regulator [Ardenticatenales bacterium]
MTTVSPSTQEARILVVEDDPNNRLVITRLLRLAGVAPENIFETESDAAEYLRAHLPDGVDLVLLDLQLPKKDGYEILQELRDDPIWTKLRVVALTANVMRQDVERARAAGFDGFIGKPIDGRRFSDVLHRLLGGESVWTVM